MFGSTPTSSGNSTSDIFGATSIFGQNDQNRNQFGTGNPFGSRLAVGSNSGTSGTIFGVRPNGGTSASFTSSTSPFGFSAGPAFTSSTFSFGFSLAPMFTSSTSSLGFSSAPAFTSSTSSFGFSSAPAFTSSTSSLGFSSAPAFGPSSSSSDRSQVTTPPFKSFAQFNNSTDLKKGSKVVSYRKTAMDDSAGTAMSISAMAEYHGKSHEELRWEDCQFNGESCWGTSKIVSTNGFSQSKPVNPFNPSTFANPFSLQPVSPFNSSSLTNSSTTSSLTAFKNISGPSVNVFSLQSTYTPFSQPSNGFQSTVNHFSPSTSSLVSQPNNGFQSTDNHFSPTTISNPISSQIPSNSSSTAFTSPFTDPSITSASTIFSSISQPSNSFQSTVNHFLPKTSSNLVSSQIPSFNFTSPSPFTSPFSNSSTTVSTTYSSPFSQPNNSSQSTVNNFSFTTSISPVSSQIPSFNNNGSISSIITPSSSVKVSPTLFQPNLFPSPPSSSLSTPMPSPLNSTPISVSSAFTLPFISPTTFTQSPPPAQCTGSEQPSPVVNMSPFGTLPPIPPMPVECPGPTQVIRQGISSMPIQNRPAPVRCLPLVGVRLLSQRSKLPLQKYDPKSNGPKIPFFADDRKIPVDALLPRENPRSLVISPVKQCAYSEDLSAQKPPSSVSGNGDEVKGANSSDKLNLTVEGTDGPVKENRVEAELVSMLPMLQLGGYYTEPRIAELAAKERAEPGFCSHVKDFVIGRHGYGSIKFYGETDVRNLDLESYVQFNKHEVIVYMDESKKPEVGKGLNKPAEVTLLNIECIDKKTGKRCIDGIRADKYKEMLMKKSAEKGVEFVSYDPVGGEWKFRVKHF